MKLTLIQPETQADGCRTVGKKSEFAVWWLGHLPKHKQLSYGTLVRREKCGLELPQVEKDLESRPPTSWTNKLINCESTIYKISIKSIFLRENCRKWHGIYFLINVRVI